jgi:ligand-binding sensor domain-containing protein
MKRLLYLVFIGSFLFILRFQTYAQEQKLRFEHLTNEHGLSGNQVYGIIQDSKGYMWFGTLSGLNKYDG